MPRDRRQPYRIRDILRAVFDAGSVMEVQRYGGSVVTALARLDGHPVGVVACDPYVAGGCLTVEGAEAVTRLADLCSTFHLPIVTLTDQPGLLIGTRAEQRGTIRHGVRAISAVYQASVPGAEIIVRRVFGVGGAGLTNRHRLIRRWAWPSADWGSLPVEGGIEAAYRADLERRGGPGRAAGRDPGPAGRGAQPAAHRGAVRRRGDHRPARDPAAAVRLGPRRLRGAARPARAARPSAPAPDPARPPRACPVDHWTGSRSQILIEATQAVPSQAKPRWPRLRGPQPGHCGRAAGPDFFAPAPRAAPSSPAAP